MDLLFSTLAPFSERNTILKTQAKSYQFFLNSNFLHTSPINLLSTLDSVTLSLLFLEPEQAAGYNLKTLYFILFETSVLSPSRLC